jgi:hypothetical protein
MDRIFNYQKYGQTRRIQSGLRLSDNYFAHSYHSLCRESVTGDSQQRLVVSTFEWDDRNNTAGAPTKKAEAK